ncbi:MAG: TIGR03790 family protein [Phycisphaerales bacterium]|nr:TIGR03790 family protein [Phycisphaerales bacterium]
MSYFALPSRSVTTFLAAAVCLAASTFAARPAAALEPAEVAVIYNSASEQSLQLAKYYMKVRNIPENNLIAINYMVRKSFPEVIPESEYRKNIVPQIRRVMAEKKFDQAGGVKCLVTMYDVPLKIGPWQGNAEEQKMLAFYNDEKTKTLDALENQIAAYDRVAAPPPPAATTEAATSQAATSPASQPATTAATKPARKGNWADALPKKLENAATEAAKRIEKLPVEQRTEAAAELIRVHLKTAGLSGMLGIQVQGDGPAADANRAEREKIQTTIESARVRASELAGHLDQPAARRELLDLCTQCYGLFGRAEQLEQFMAPFAETEACFDNELALVLADQNYSRGRWIINPRNVAVYPATLGRNGAVKEGVLRTIMVCRIDGETMEKAQEMIDRTLEIEKKGLEGKMYLDARGIKAGGYASMDIQMRQLNAWMKTHSTMECFLDDKPALLQAKDCPDAALYCGWYSLGTYVDSCQWLPGAVGYHVASGEMGSLHKKNNTQWVVNLLNRGFCGTMGPTSEPYLTAFANPAHFFPLLLCGEFTQGEVWEVTAPWLSWRVGFVGDPLYNPFKAHPKAKVEDIQKDPVLRNAFLMLRPEMKLPAAEKSQQPSE